MSVYKVTAEKEGRALARVLDVDKNRMDRQRAEQRVKQYKEKPNSVWRRRLPGQI